MYKRQKLAFVAATRADKFIFTQEAGATQPGVLRTYEPALFLQAVTEARKNSDFVAAYFDKPVLREVDESAFSADIAGVREKLGDRAVPVSYTHLVAPPPVRPGPARGRCRKSCRLGEGFAPGGEADRPTHLRQRYKPDRQAASAGKCAQAF